MQIKKIENTEKPEVKLAGGITMDSGMQDVLDAYGEPDDTFNPEGSDYYQFDYHTAEGQQMIIVVQDERIMTVKLSRLPGDEEPAA